MKRNDMKLGRRSLPCHSTGRTGHTLCMHALTQCNASTSFFVSRSLHYLSWASPSILRVTSSLRPLTAAWTFLSSFSSPS